MHVRVPVVVTDVLCNRALDSNSAYYYTAIKGLKAVAAAAYGLASRRFVKPSKIAAQNGQHYSIIMNDQIYLALQRGTRQINS